MALIVCIVIIIRKCYLIGFLSNNSYDSHSRKSSISFRAYIKHVAASWMSYFIIYALRLVFPFTSD